MSNKIGVYHKNNKNWYRNITRHDHRDFTYEIFYDIYRILNATRRRIGAPVKEFYKYSRSPPSYPKVDLYHHWRSLDFGSTPWVVSTSAGLPFGWPSDRYGEGLKLLASEACKRIIVTGQCALEWQRSKVKNTPSLAKVIMEKVEVLPPAQELLVSEWNEKPVGKMNPLRLAFVGNMFFRKGGLELVRVVKRLRSEGADVTLDVVSSLKFWHQMKKGEQHKGKVQRLMEEISGVTWHGKLPNPEVLNLFKQSHIGLLPSYIETYGYTVLEAQASGCPTITTDVKAFPDINTDEVGWRIETNRKEYSFRSKKGRSLISNQIEQGLYRILRKILEDRSVVREKGKAALARIEEEHSPTKHRERLQSIYKEALN